MSMITRNFIKSRWNHTERVEWQRKVYDEKIIRPYSNLQVLSTNGSKILLPSLLCYRHDKVLHAQGGLIFFISFIFYYYTAGIIVILMPISAKALRRIRIEIREKVILKDKHFMCTPKPLLHKPSYLKNSHIQILLNQSLYHGWLL